MTPEWSQTQLGQVGRWLSGGTPSLEAPEYWGGSVPWASAKDMKRFELWDTEDHITEKGLEKGSRAVEAGNLLIVVRGMILAHTFPVAIAMTRMWRCRWGGEAQAAQMTHRCRNGHEWR